MNALISLYTQRRYSFFIFLGVGALFFLFFIRAFGTGDSLPPLFTEARREGVAVAQEIVAISNESVAGFQNISKFDELGQYVQALDLVYVEMNRSRDMRARAILLYEKLQTMTNSLEEFSSSRDRGQALHAISYQVALVTHLTGYNDLLNQLLEALRSKFLGYSTDDGAIQDLIPRINEEIRKINALNDQFTEAIGKI